MSTNPQSTGGAALSPRSPLLQELYDYWNRQRGSRCMPARRDMDPIGIRPKLLPWIMILDVEQAPRRFRYRLVGTRVVELLDRDLTGRYLDEQADILGAVVEEARAKYETVADDRVPLAFEGDLVDFNGDRVWVERLALPLGETDDLVQGIMVGFASIDHPDSPKRTDGPEAA